MILRKGEVGEIYNIGTTREISNIEVTHALLDIFNIPKEKHEQRMYYVKNRCFNDQRYSLDVSKLESLGWKASTSFEDGLKKTVEWYLNHRSNWDETDNALVPHPRFGQKEI